MVASITLLGAFNVADTQGIPVRFRSDKVRALLAYLAVEQRCHARAHLAALLWPDQPDELALRNLSQTLVRLREALGDGDAATPFLLVSRQTVQWNPQAPASIDVAAFLRGLRESVPSVLRRVAALYGGAFMPGFSLPDSAPFDEWLALTREQLERQALEALDALTQSYLAASAFPEAETAARRQLAIDPWREEAHRSLMLALAGSGQRAAALAAYATCRRALFVGLGVEPDDATTALYEQIKETRRRGDKGAASSNATVLVEDFSVSPSPRLPVSPPPVALVSDWGDAPDLVPLYGREAELATLEGWLLGDRCRLVALIGMGGQGKTALATHLAQAVAPRFEALIWRSLVNAPPIDDVLKGVLEALAPEQPVALHATTDERLKLLLNQMRQRPCLLVLDNVETILQTGSAPNDMATRGFRPGYEAYGLLLQRVGQGRHQSCLLLTSREEPVEVARQAGERQPVRTLLLKGLEAEAGQAVIEARGLALPADNAAMLVEHYSGNPLALRLVAETIREFFAGDTGAFLAEDTPIFDDIRAVLDQQWVQLSPLERELLLWLAIEREPVPLDALQRNLVATSARGPLLDALRALQRRALIELHPGGGFALQNVVTEYTTGQLITQICDDLEAEQMHGLRRYALFKADVKEYVRQSQIRLLLAPVARWLVARFGLAGIGKMCKRLLNVLRAEGPQVPGYAAGNLLNLLVHLDIDLADYDFSQLCVWQADLRDVVALDIDFAEAHFANAAFTDIFDAVNSVTFDPDGTRVAAGSNNGVVGMWRVADGQRHALFVGHAITVWSVAFSANGSLLASASSDATVRLWDVVSGATTMVLHGHSGAVIGIAFVPGSPFLATGGTDGTIRLWDWRDGVCHKVLDRHGGSVRALAVAGDGTLLAECDYEGIVRLWNIAGGICIHALAHPHMVECVAFSPDGKQLVTGARDKIARVWNTSTGHVVRTLEGHHERICSAAWSPDGHVIATGGYDITIRLWDATSGEQIRVLRGHIGNVYGLAWSPDGTLIVSAGHDESVRLWSARSGDELQTLRGYPAGVLSAAFSPDGRTLFTTQGHVVRVWDVQARRLRRVLRGHRDVLSTVRGSPDGTRVASSGHDRAVRLWDSVSGRLVHVLAGHTDVVHGLAFSPDSSLLATASDDMSVRLWDVHSGQPLRILTGHTFVVVAVVFSPDGRLLFSRGGDRTVRVWEVASGRELHVLRNPNSDDVLWLALSPDGTMLLHSFTNSGITVRDARSLEQIRQIETPGGTVSCLAFSPDGSRLVTGSSDFKVRLWDTASWRARVIGEHASWISAAAWSPDGSRLVTTTTIGEIALWEGQTGARLGDLRDAGPYAGTNIAGASGLTNAQRATLLALGAVEKGP